jgi:protein-disulfide isomerase
MSFIKRNIWGVGFAVILIGAFAVMILASKNSNLPSPTAVADETIAFTISADEHVKGAENAKAVLVKFSDFECPACAAYYPVVDQLLLDFPADLRVVYRHFPLRTIHFQAENAAQASEAAALQGKFWEMHKALFDSQSEWSRQRGLGAFEAIAQSIGLDMEQYRTDVESDSVKEAVSEDSDFAVEHGLNSTPTFYLNGKKITNPQSYEAFRELIAAEIAQTP